VAKDIFVNAVSQLSIQDAIGIVRGADNAATTYLQGKTADRLAQLFSPILKKDTKITKFFRYFGSYRPF